jgi:hypothetical protein
MPAILANVGSNASSVANLKMKQAKDRLAKKKNMGKK